MVGRGIARSSKDNFFSEERRIWAYLKLEKKMLYTERFGDAEEGREIGKTNFSRRRKGYGN